MTFDEPSPMRVGSGASAIKALGTRAGKILAISVLAWVIAVGFGLRALVLYSNTAGVLATAPKLWPTKAPIRPAQARASLLIFAHPQCPCSRATLGELERLLTCCGGQLQTTVFFSQPTGAPKEWMNTELWQIAARLPGVQVREDVDAAAARLFGARVSGQVLLYDAGGELAFNGGITSLRGHMGDNDGRDSIRAIVSRRAPQRRTTPVFGCALY